MTLNQRRKRKRGETRSGHIRITVFTQKYIPMIFILNGWDETREIRCRVWE